VLQVTEINDPAQFLELKNKWNEVLIKSNDGNVFLTWEFLSTCWNLFGSGKKLRILIIKDEEEIIAIAPFRQSRLKFGNFFGYDVIEFLGEGADYTGLILTEKKSECFCLIIDYLMMKGDWDFINLFNLPETSIIPQYLSKNSKSLPKFELKQGKICPFISLPNSTDAFMLTLDNAFRKDLRRCQKNLEQDYGRIELKKYDAYGSVEKGLTLFFDLHQERWHSKVGQGLFETEKNRDFFRKVSKQFAENGWLALYFLTVKGVPIATQYCVEYKERVFYTLSGFSMQYSKYSPGNVLTMKIIEDCIQRQIKEFDFMKGDEFYKFKWTKQYRTNFGIRFVNRKFSSNLYEQVINFTKKTGLDRVLSGYITRP
jgi:hypothetical protein